MTVALRTLQPIHHCGLRSHINDGTVHTQIAGLQPERRAEPLSEDYSIGACPHDGDELESRRLDTRLEVGQNDVLALASSARHLLVV